MDETAWKVDNGPFRDADEVLEYMRGQAPAGVQLTSPESRPVWRPEHSFFGIEAELSYDDSTVTFSIQSRDPLANPERAADWIYPRPTTGFPPVVYLGFQDSQDYGVELEINNPWRDYESRKVFAQYEVNNADEVPGTLAELVRLADMLRDLEGPELDNTVDLLWLKALPEAERLFHPQTIQFGFDQRLLNFEPQHWVELHRAVEIILAMQARSSERLLAEQLLETWVGSAWGLFRLVEATTGSDMRNVLAQCPAPTWIEYPERYPGVDPVTGSSSAN